VGGGRSKCSIGFVPLESVLFIGAEQMCYVKEPSGWKIAGFLGSEATLRRVPHRPDRAAGVGSYGAWRACGLTGARYVYMTSVTYSPAIQI
jgi:hypothetical protein